MDEALGVLEIFVRQSMTSGRRGTIRMYIIRVSGSGKNLLKELVEIGVACALNYSFQEGRENIPTFAVW